MKFAVLLKRLVARHRHTYPTHRSLAEALDIDPSHLSRAMSKHGQPFDVKGCLRLAQLLGEPAGEILRAAGKEEIAKLIEGLYGPVRVTLSPEQRRLLTAYGLIREPAARQSLIVLAQAAGGGTVQSESGNEAGGDSGTGTLPPPKDPDHVMQPELVAAGPRARVR
jgi:hypothetical protein